MKGKIVDGNCIICGNPMVILRPDGKPIHVDCEQEINTVARKKMKNKKRSKKGKDDGYINGRTLRFVPSES